MASKKRLALMLVAVTTTVVLRGLRIANRIERDRQPPTPASQPVTLALPGTIEASGFYTGDFVSGNGAGLTVVAGTEYTETGEQSDVAIAHLLVLTPSSTTAPPSIGGAISGPIQRIQVTSREFADDGETTMGFDVDFHAIDHSLDLRHYSTQPEELHSFARAQGNLFVIELEDDWSTRRVCQLPVLVEAMPIGTATILQTYQDNLEADDAVQSLELVPVEYEGELVAPGPNNYPSEEWVDREADAVVVGESVNCT